MTESEKCVSECERIHCCYFALNAISVIKIIVAKAEHFAAILTYGSLRPWYLNCCSIIIWCCLPCILEELFCYSNLRVSWRDYRATGKLIMLTMDGFGCILWSLWIQCCYLACGASRRRYKAWKRCWIKMHFL